jgi:hypothetical protein
MKMHLRSERGIMLIWFYLLIVVLIITSGSLYALSMQETRLVQIDTSRDQAFYLAEAAADQILQNIRAANFEDIPNQTVPFGLGQGNYSAQYCSPTTTPCGGSEAALSKITATGTVGGFSKTLSATIEFIPTPPGVDGSITSGTDLTINGNFNIDGRDHDMDGNIIGGEGANGISSGGDVNLGGSSVIGGNGIAPSNPADPDSYEEVTGTRTFTPESALGLPPGSLDQYKQASPPRPQELPIHGITYITSDWIGVNLGDVDDPSTGILIVHNDAGDAVLKNMHGYFKGVVITDNLTHLNGNLTLIGAIVIQNNFENSLGNGNADFFYSSEALTTLPEPASGDKIGTWIINSWQDVQNA